MSSTLRERTVLPPENPADLVRFARGMADAEAPARAKLVGPDGSIVPWDGESVGELEVRGPWITAARRRRRPVPGHGRLDRPA